MTALPGPLDDATIEAALARRGAGNADAALLSDVLAAARATPQVRGWWPPLRGSRQAWALLAAALLLAAAVVVGVGASRTAPPPAPEPSAPAIVVPSASAAPATSPTVVATPSAAASTSAECPPDPTGVTTGDAMPPTRSEPMALMGDGLDLGVYLTAADVWTVRTGSATRIASLGATDAGLARIDDLSQDGRFAVAELGQTINASPLVACNNLYVIGTDGTSATTRITRFGAHEHASDARFSPDGRFLAFRFDDLSGHTPVVGLIDLIGDPTPRTIECGETSMFDFAWARDGHRLAMVCGGRLDVVSAEAGLVESSTVLPFHGEIFMELAWSDAETTVLVTALDNGIGVSDAPVRVRSVASGAVSNPVPVSPALTYAGPGSATAPDGHAVAVVAFPRDKTIGWHVIDTSTGAAQAVAGPGCSDLAWSADGRSVLFVEGGPATTVPALTVVDLATAARQFLGSVPADYRGGVFRGR
ncbi:MAG: hypothetical protein ACJ77F_07415 [Chloroflexota bacterium]